MFLNSFTNLLEMDPEAQRGPMMAVGPDAGGRGWTPSQEQLAVGFACLLLVRVLNAPLTCWFGLPFSIVPLFSFSPTFSLHADKFLCFTSPKTPSSSWMSPLSELCICLFSSRPWLFLIASARARTHCASYCTEALRFSVK